MNCCCWILQPAVASGGTWCCSTHTLLWMRRRWISLIIFKNVLSFAVLLPKQPFRVTHTKLLLWFESFIFSFYCDVCVARALLHIPLKCICLTLWCSAEPSGVWVPISLRAPTGLSTTQMYRQTKMDATPPFFSRTLMNPKLRVYHHTCHPLVDFICLVIDDGYFSGGKLNFWWTLGFDILEEEEEYTSCTTAQLGAFWCRCLHLSPPLMHSS